MIDSATPYDQIIKLSVIINADTEKVWQALTLPAMMKQWMFELPIDINTDWTIGGPITISGDMGGKYFENKGTVLKYQPEVALSYSHLSSLSALPNEIKYYSVIDFELTALNNQTILSIFLSNFPTSSIYHHLAYYWSVTIEVLKIYCEQQSAANYR